MKRTLTAVSAVSLLALAVLTTRIAAQGTELSAEPGLHHGLAAQYPGDVGIAADSAVVFAEDFDTGFILDVISRWTSTNNKDGRVLSLVKDTPPGSSGKNSLLVTGINGHDNGGDLWKLLSKGYDRLYLRFYCKFAPDAPYVHHFVALGGKTSTNPYPEGGAGSRPNGYDGFSSTIDLSSGNANPPGGWFFYTYWSEMHSWQTPEGESAGQANPFYGNPFGPDNPNRVEQAKRGEWQCVEIMIKINTPPDGRDGEEAFWIDGRLVGYWVPGSHSGTWFRDKFHRGDEFDTNPKPFGGFLWRKTDALKINYIWLQYYLEGVYGQKPKDSSFAVNPDTARVEFDNVVAATRYIGPIVSPAEADSLKMGFDFNRDGNLGVGDVYRLLKMRIADPDDMRTDYNGDGRLTLSDAVQFLLDVLKGRSGSQ